MADRGTGEVQGRVARPDGVELAYRFRRGMGPTVVFLPGYASDMTGAKGTALDEMCAAQGRALLRLDYSGHGASGGSFTHGTIGQWAEDARVVIAAVAPGPRVLVGSSMGGWIALLLALSAPGDTRALVGIAAAPDFTEDLMWEAMGPPERAALLRDGRIEVPSRYGANLIITRRLIEEGRERLLLRGPIALAVPVRLLHGQQDAEVPWETSLRLAERITGADVRITLIKDGDHRLSRPADLALLAATVLDLLGEDGAQALPEAGVAPGDTQR